MLTNNGHFESLGEMAALANHLAKELSGAQRDLAYRIKAAACSELICAGMARVNGLRANNVLGLDILTEPSLRLHVPLSRLKPEARTIVREQVSTAPRTVPLAELAGCSSLTMFAAERRAA